MSEKMNAIQNYKILNFCQAIFSRPKCGKPDQKEVVSLKLHLFCSNLKIIK